MENATDLNLSKTNSSNLSLVILVNERTNDILTWLNILTAIVLFLIVLITIFGNILVLIAVYVNKKLQTTFNYYVVNLAITDFAVAVTAMSFHTTDNVLGYWPFGEILCGVWIFFDYGMTFVSVFTLVLISFDRFWSVTWSVHYRNHHSKKNSVIAIICSWLFMLALWLPPCIYDRLQNGKPGECILEPSLNREFVVVVTTIGHHGSCLVIVFCYLKVLIYMFKLKKRKSLRAQLSNVSVIAETTTHAMGESPTVFSETTPELSMAAGCPTSDCPSPVLDETAEEVGVSIGDVSSKIETRQQPTTDAMKSNNRKYQRRERSVFITLTYVIVGYAMFWIPFHVVFDVSSVCPSCVPRGVYAVTFWMTYINSTINPFLYNFSTPEFRRTFKRLLCRR